MGLELVVPRAAAPSIGALLARLAAGGLAATVMMVDGQLHPPAAPVGESWSDVRVRTPAGTVSLRRRPDGVAVVVFGNADPALVAAQQAVADAVREV